MNYNFNTFKKRIAEIEQWLATEYSTLRTGRATLAVLDKVVVDSYGSSMPIKNVANMSVEDARTLRVVPWDKTQIAAIEKAIVVEDLGVSVVNDGQGLRIVFPELTGESRERTARLAKQKLEDARVSLRKEREEVWSDIQKKEKDGDMNEDEKFRSKEDMQNITDEANNKLDVLLAKKEDEILNQ